MGIEAPVFGHHIGDIAEVKMKGFIKEQGADIIEITDLIQIKQQTLSRAHIYGKSSL